MQPVNLAEGGAPEKAGVAGGRGGRRGSRPSPPIDPPPGEAGPKAQQQAKEARQQSQAPEKLLEQVQAMQGWNTEKEGGSGPAGVPGFLHPNSQDLPAALHAGNRHQVSLGQADRPACRGREPGPCAAWLGRERTAPPHPTPPPPPSPRVPK